MAYITQQDILNNIDAQNLGAMCDDYSMGPNGTLQSQILNNILQLASTKSDSFVCSIYITPFTTVPNKIYQASIVFACDMLYTRRLTPAEQNPFHEKAKYWEETLIKIGDGDIPLDARFARAFPPVITRVSRSPLDTNTY
jgi:phage gp36-like protein